MPWYALYPNQISAQLSPTYAARKLQKERLACNQLIECRKPVPDLAMFTAFLLLICLLSFALSLISACWLLYQPRPLQKLSARWGWATHVQKPPRSIDQVWQISHEACWQVATFSTLWGLNHRSKERKVLPRSLVKLLPARWSSREVGGQSHV